ncbi:MAG: polysaccharide biosynthesis protein [Firmicutes bacterium]|nr:polysaccharide biosynthesis protein [Bacillota bacterium]
MSRGRVIIKGAAVLTFANLISRIMGFVYRIFMSKAIGARGMGVLQLIMPVYMLVFSLCSSGLATTVSTCTAAGMAKDDKGGVRKILHTALYFSVVLSIAASAAVFFGAEPIGRVFLHEPDTVRALKILSFCFPFMSAGACLRGYFCGIQKMGVPAAAQVAEQCVRIGVVYCLCGVMLSRGMGYACAMAVMGMASGEIVSFLLTYIFYFLRKKELLKYTSMTNRQAVDTVLSAAVPLTLNRGVSSCLAAFENTLIPQRLMLSGMTNEQALSVFGGLCGMAAPLIMFPCSLLTALATALMPAISEYASKNDFKAVGALLRRALLFTAVVGIFGCGIFIVFPSEIALAVYGRADIAGLLRLLGVICPFLYTQVIMSAALNGVNCQFHIFKMGILSSCITIFAIWFLMPRFGIHAYIAAWAASAVITNRLCALRLERVSDKFGISPICAAKCALCVAFVCTAGKCVVRRLPISGLFGLCVLIGACAAVYLALLNATDTAKISDLLKTK